MRCISRPPSAPLAEAALFYTELEKTMTYDDYAPPTVSEVAGNLRNNERTCEPADTRLTQPRSADVPVKKFADHSMTAWGYTYFVRRDDLIKIGHTGAPKQRMNGISNWSNPIPARDMQRRQSPLQSSADGSHPNLEQGASDANCAKITEIARSAWRSFAAVSRSYCRDRGD